MIEGICNRILGADVQVAGLVLDGCQERLAQGMASLRLL